MRPAPPCRIRREELTAERNGRADARSLAWWYDAVMDPTTFNTLVDALQTVLGVLVICGCPVGILWVLKHHQLRMKELELEGKAIERGREPRIAGLEKRVASLESALGSAPDRPALMGSPDAPLCRMPATER